MPLFKKSGSDSGTLPDGQLRALRRCRMALIRDVDVVSVLDAMLAEEAIKTDWRDHVLQFSSREERVGVLLDRLETRGERAFAAFLDALRERHKHLHFVLQEATRNLDSVLDEEEEALADGRGALTGEGVRRVLRAIVRRKAGSESADDLDMIGAEDSDEGECGLDCFAMPTGRGERRLKRSWRPGGAAREVSYTAVVLKDVILRRVDRADMPAAVRRPAAKCDVFMREPEAPAWRGVRGAVTTVVTSGEDSVPDEVPPPPPVPPKPENLLPLSLRPHLPRSAPSGGHDDMPPPDRPPPRTASRADTRPSLKPKPATEPRSRSPLRKAELPPPPPPPPLPPPLVNHVNDSNLLQTPNAVDELSDSEALALEIPPADDDDDDDEGDDANGVTYSPVSTFEPPFIRRKLSKMAEASHEYDLESPSTHVKGFASVAAGVLETSLDGAPTTVDDDDDDDTYEAVAVSQDKPALPLRYSSGAESSRYSGPPLSRESTPADGGESSRETSTDSEGRAGRRGRASFAPPPPPPPPPPALPAQRPPQPCGLADVQILHQTDNLSDSDNSYYEDIDSVDRRAVHSPTGKYSASYLDPKSYFATFEAAKTDTFTADKCVASKDWESIGRLVLRKGDLLVAELEPVRGDVTAEPAGRDVIETGTAGRDVSEEDTAGSGESAQDNGASPPAVVDDVFQGTVLAFDKSGHACYLSADLLARYGDPDGEPWFYPAPLSPRQATLFLRREKQEGCFLLYRPTGDAPGGIAAYYLSVYRASRGDVLHYKVTEDVYGDLMLDGHDTSFMTIHELVRYFQRNRAQLVTRLRRPLAEARMSVTAGYHYHRRWEITRAALSLSGTILGKGSYGVVIAGSYHNVPVAVKLLQKSEATVEDQDDFIEEAKMLMGLSHDQVVSFVGVSCSATPFFIVTRYYSRGILRDCLRRKALASDNIDILFDMCMQVTAASVYLESRRYVLHRDLCTRNYLVADDMCVKLADFGRAKFVTDDYYQAPRTEGISVKWAAPEVLIESVYSSRCDVWSLGVVFWEIFSGGARPFNALSDEQTVVFVSEGGRLDKPPGCSADIFAVMKSCWRDAAAERPSFERLFETLKSKSNVYYSSTLVAKRDEVLLPTCKDVNGRPTPPPPHHHHHTPSSTSSKGGRVPSRPASPPLPRRAGDDGARDVFVDDRSAHRVSRERLHTSGSDTSLSSTVTAGEFGRDDGNRNNKIRKSIRKLMSMKTKHKQYNKATAAATASEGDRYEKAPASTSTRV